MDIGHPGSQGGQSLILNTQPLHGIIHFETFLLAGILLNLTPGNDTIYILTKSIAQGRKAGILSVLGIATGSLIHTTLAGFGLSVIIAQSILAFNLVKYAGAAYLVYLGLRMLADPSRLEAGIARQQPRMKSFNIYRDAVLTNVLNPKVAMFFIAFLPQFIDAGHRNDIVPFLLLGITFTITGTVWCLVLASFSSFLFAKLRTNPGLSFWLNKTCGAVLIGLGLKIALTEKK
jgi:threonine/homoserine/homoserine lactone efflux protein